MRTVFGHGQLRLYMLTLLERGPLHGYEIMRCLEERFDGLYVPSAGTIYPRLAKLEEDGMVVRRDEGRKATYRITAAGRAELRDRDAEVRALETSLDAALTRLAEAEVGRSTHVRSVAGAVEGLAALWGSALVVERLWRQAGAETSPDVATVARFLRGVQAAATAFSGTPEVDWAEDQGRVARAGAEPGTPPESEPDLAAQDWQLRSPAQFAALGEILRDTAARIEAVMTHSPR